MHRVVTEVETARELLDSETVMLRDMAVAAVLDKMLVSEVVQDQTVLESVVHRVI